MSFEIKLKEGKILATIYEKIPHDITKKYVFVGYYFGKVYSDLIRVANGELILNEIIKQDVYSSAEIIDEILDGYYLLVIRKDDEYILLRDPIGFLATYMFELNNEIVLKDRRIYTFNNKLMYGFRYHPCYILSRKRGLKSFKITYNLHKLFYSAVDTKSILNDINEVSSYLAKYYQSRLENILKGYRREVYVSYSGGLDSSVVLKLLVDMGLEVVAIFLTKRVGENNSALKLIKQLGVDYIVVTRPDVKKATKDIDLVLEITEDNTPMNISLALAQYWVFKEVPQGRILALGQGADEVFGGYQKFVEILKEGGYDALRDEIHKVLLFSYLVNFEREWKLAYSSNIRLIYPLISPGVTYIVHHTPLKFLVENQNDEMRKHILRHIARKLNLPRDIYLAKKKSLQYVSGSMDILRKIAKKHGLKPYQYLQERYRYIIKYS